MRRAVVWGVSILSVLLVLPAAFAEQAADPGADWRPEFEAVCSQTDTSSALGDEDLAQLIARCDQLAKRLDTEPEVVRRVFLKRLQRCRELFVFVLESRKAAAPAGQEASSPADPPPGAPAVPPPASSSP